MADRRFQLVLATAVVVALGATYGVYTVLERERARTQVPTRPVVVAAEDVPEGARLEPRSVAVKQWPAVAAPVGAFPAADSVVGRVTRVAVFRGEPIVPGRLAPSGTYPGLEVKITPGRRAMAVKINDVVGLAGLIQPNSRVDVLVTLKDDEKQADKRAKVFMSNMRVLSVGTQVERGADGKPINATTAALEVTPAEAERLAVAMNEGTIQLVLRGYGDPDSISTRGATSSDVLAQLRVAPPATPPAAPAARRASPPPRRVERVVVAPPRPAPPAAEPAPARPARPDSAVVQVYRGDKMSQQKFERRDSLDQTKRP